MKVSEAMTRDVHVASPHETISDATKVIAALDAGALPVGDNGRLLGMITAATLPCVPSRPAKGPKRRFAK